MRTGEEVLVSLAMSIASLVRKPRALRPNLSSPSRNRLLMNFGIQKCKGEAMTPGEYDDCGRSDESRPFTKSSILWAGATCVRPPLSHVCRSISSCNAMIANGLCSTSPFTMSLYRAFNSLVSSANCPEATSSGRISTTIAELAQREPRDEADIPFTTTCSGPVADGTTTPPGHIQKLYTPRPSA